ncbi:antibiotic biosynthesis monooxygenase family protein [Ulvibacter antarcticus]|uniref:ABM domain-containing protein n=1 Tax=Ulvibacter antarcticus TaxID=442714 RepID=A0A3L9Z3A8_9FLAO|nr:hypothetical protein [Ulvibacter antarcticus]RMA64785.1 hypothetical protein BXY75_1666 [Ulvibacter antarcticus]
MKHLLLLTTLFLTLTSFTQLHPEKRKSKEIIIEVTTFKIKSDIDIAAFEKRDQSTKREYTAKQPGFMKRMSGVSENGEYVVVVYWKTMANAEASMSKFMSDSSVADYMAMIDNSTMKMSRYKMLKRSR